MFSLVGLRIRSPAFVSPPNNIIASGLENITKFASANPNICPVNSNISFASLSPATAASKTFFESICSGVYSGADFHQYFFQAFQ